MGAGCPPSTPLGVGASYRSPQVGNGYGLRRSPSAHQTPERVGASSPVTSMGNGCGILLSSPATLAGERCRLRSGPPSERWASGGSGRALLSTESSYPCRVALFYPRPLRPARGSAPRRSAPAARRQAAPTGARPLPPPPTGPPSSRSHLLSQWSARASTKPSTPGPRPRNRSLSGANTNPGRRRSVGTPWVSARARTPPLASSLPTSTLVHLITVAGSRSSW